MLRSPIVSLTYILIVPVKVAKEQLGYCRHEIVVDAVGN